MLYLGLRCCALMSHVMDVLKFLLITIKDVLDMCELDFDL